jgi:hypothetical protein
MLLADDTIAVTTDGLEESIAPTSIVGTACVAVSGLSNPAIAAYRQTSCFLATYSSQATGFFALPAGVDSSSWSERTDQDPAPRKHRLVRRVPSQGHIVKNRDQPTAVTLALHDPA